MNKWTNPVEWEKAGRNAKGKLIIRATNQATFYSEFGPVMIFEGDLSDGASTPRLVWPLISPLDSDIEGAAWPHDMIYADKRTRFTRRQADKILVEAMKEAGAPFWKRAVVYLAVRAAGWIPWRTKKKHQIVIASPS